MGKKRMLSLVLALVMVLSMGVGLVRAEEEQKTLRILVNKPPVIEDMNTNDVSLWLEEITGVKVTYDQVPSENIKERVALMMAGNDLPDAFLNCGIESAQLVQYGAEDGAFVALDEYIEEGAPNLKKAMEAFEQGIDMLREVDGHIYSLPAINPCYHCSRAMKMWINDAWVQNLGLSHPTTTDEFYEMLKAFKENDPNGNGVADEIPLTGSTDGWYTQSLAFVIPSFLYFDYEKKGFVLNDEQQVVNGLSAEGFREAMRYINKLYSEGLLYEGTLTQKNDQLKKLVENPEANLVGATTAGYGGQFSTELGGERYREFRPISPLKGPEGLQYAVSIVQEPGLGAFVVTSACEDPLTAVKWADAFYTHEVTASIYNGLEGVGWRWAEDGETDFDGNPALWTALKPYGGDVGSVRNDAWTQMGIYNFSKQWRSGQTADLDQDMWSMEGMEFMLHCVTRDLYEPYSADKYRLPTLKHTDDEFTRVTDLKMEFDKYFDEAIFNFVTGAWNVDSDWEMHLENLEMYGLSELLGYYQTAFDRMYAAK